MGKHSKMTSISMHGQPATNGMSGCTSVYRHADGTYQAARFRAVDGRWVLLSLLGDRSYSRYSRVTQIAGNMQMKGYRYLKPVTKLVPRQPADETVEVGDEIE